MAIQWRKISNYCIGCAEGYKVDRSWCQGVEMFGLSYQGQHLAYCSNANEARSAAEEHLRSSLCDGTG